jgi:hypothetical protein
MSTSTTSTTTVAGTTMAGGAAVVGGGTGGGTEGGTGGGLATSGGTGGGMVTSGGGLAQSHSRGLVRTQQKKNLLANSSGSLGSPEPEQKSPPRKISLFQSSAGSTGPAASSQSTSPQSTSPRSTSPRPTSLPDSENSVTTDSVYFPTDLHTRCQALWSLQGQADNELTFTAGDTMVVLRKDPGGWWEAEMNGRIGWIPHNYVREF